MRLSGAARAGWAWGTTSTARATCSIWCISRFVPSPGWFPDAEVLLDGRTRCATRRCRSGYVCSPSVSRRMAAVPCPQSVRPSRRSAAIAPNARSPTADVNIDGEGFRILARVAHTPAADRSIEPTEAELLSGAGGAYCVRCVMDTSDPDITFDSAGVSDCCCAESSSSAFTSVRRVHASVAKCGRPDC